MIRDAFRACLVMATLAVAASIVLETRLRLLAMEHAGRTIVGQPSMAYAAPMPTAPPQAGGRLHELGRAAINFADAAMSVVR